jgi:hypothetical protein
MERTVRAPARPDLRNGYRKRTFNSPEPRAKRWQAMAPQVGDHAEHPACRFSRMEFDFKSEPKAEVTHALDGPFWRRSGNAARPQKLRDGAICRQAQGAVIGTAPATFLNHDNALCSSSRAFSH